MPNITRYNFAYFLQARSKFSAQYKLNPSILGPAFLVAAEEFYADYYQRRFRKSLTAKNLLINPNNLAETPVHVRIYSTSKNKQASTLTAEFMFPLGHRHSEVINRGYAQKVITIFVSHVLEGKPIPEYNPLDKNYESTGEGCSNLVRVKLPIEITARRILPALGEAYLPLFSEQSRAPYALRKELQHDPAAVKARNVCP